MKCLEYMSIALLILAWDYLVTSLCYLKYFLAAQIISRFFCKLRYQSMGFAIKHYVTELVK